MGEYIQLATGEVVKVGTLEDCYYTTFGWLRAAVAAGAKQVPGNLPPADYLNPAYGWRYRFPFPDETMHSVGTVSDYNRGVTVSIPAALLHSDHDQVVVHLFTLGQRNLVSGDPYLLAMRVGCPLDPDPAQRPATTAPAQPVAQVLQQKQVEGALWVVLRCPYCGVLWRVPPSDGATLVAHLREQYTGDRFVLAIADEIERGYRAAGEEG